jgi:hypothetical protein
MRRFKETVLRHQKVLMLALFIMAAGALGAFMMAGHAVADSIGCINNWYPVNNTSPGRRVGTSNTDPWNQNGYEYQTYNFSYNPPAGGDAGAGTIQDCYANVPANFDAGNHYGQSAVAAYLGSPTAGHTWALNNGYCATQPLTDPRTRTRCTDSSDTLGASTKNYVGFVDDGGSVTIGSDMVFCWDVYNPPANQPAQNCPGQPLINALATGQGRAYFGAGFAPSGLSRDITDSFGTTAGVLNTTTFHMVAENTAMGGYEVAVIITFKYPLPYSNHATLTPNSPPADTVVKAGDTISLAPGMYNDGTGIGGATTVQLTNPNPAYFQVQTAPPIPTGGDPYVTSASYGGGATAATWQRSKSPGMYSTDPSYSIVQYSPIDFKVIGNPPPGDYCFHTVVTPQNNAGGSANSPDVCFKVKVVVTCGNLTTNPAIPEPGQTFTATPSFSINPGATANTNFTITISASGIATRSANGSVSTGGKILQATITGLSAPAGQYSGSYTISGGFSLSCPFGGGNPIPPIVVAVKPYLRVYGGDVLAGNGFGENCTTTSSQIITYNQGASGGFAGAGTQFAAQASGAITEFASAALRAPPTPTPNPPKGLTFANTGGAYGGSFGTAACNTDYSAATGATDPPGGVVGGGYTSIAAGSHIVLKHAGDVIITSDIKYNPGAWTVTNLPSFYLIVIGGNIYINKGVTNLDGVYVAQDKNGAGGTIYTCSTGASLVDNNNLYSECSQKLTINGAFVAKTVKFLRTNGTLRNASPNKGADNNIAELFNYSPELWLAPGPISDTSVRYSSITSLPPIL